MPEFFILNVDGSDEPSEYNDLGRVTLRSRLHQAHRQRRGLDSEKAEEMFISHAQSLPDYGAHYYIATADMKELDKMVTSQQAKSKKPPTVRWKCLLVFFPYIHYFFFMNFTATWWEYRNQ